MVYPSRVTPDPPLPTDPEKRCAAVFLDRDGTLIEDRGALRSPDQVVWLPEAVPALQRLVGHYELFLVTHQPGIARGEILSEEADRLHRWLVDELATHGVPIRAVYMCPHRREEGCACIKPNPTFLHEAARQFELDLPRSFVVGDHPHDVALAERASATGLYVRTGHGEKHRSELPPETVIVPSLAEAVDWILAVREAEVRLGDFGLIIQRAADQIRSGGLVVFPTETVYGIGANALDPQAVARVFEIKERPRFDPLIVHVSGPSAVEPLVTELTPLARRLIERFWPGPLTLVLPKRPEIPDLVTAGLPTVAVRCPRHPVAWALLREARVPIAAPSANRFGQLSPTRAEHVSPLLAEAPEVTLIDGGPCPLGVESTIVSLIEKEPEVLRWGALPIELLEPILGPICAASEGEARPRSPGRFPRHYAPRTPVCVVREGDRPPGSGRRGLLAYRRFLPEDGQAFKAVQLLSPTGNLREAAAYLFSALHELDAKGLDLIVAEAVPEEGLGRAINDRLRRAAVAAP